MADRTNLPPALCGRTEVGKWYMVPCVKVDTSCRSLWMDVNGWVPVFGPKHQDAEFLEFHYDHWHIDWRFVGHAQFRHVTDGGRAPHSSVLTSDTSVGYDRRLTRSPVLRRIKCKREMPEFPVVSKFVVREPSYGPPHTMRWQRLERAQAITCNKLKPGNICPHRGIDLTPFIKEDGTVICPGHGLRWDTKTGDLLPYQAQP